MFAWLAVLCFVLELAGINIGSIDSFMLGMILLGLHFAIGAPLFYGIKIGRNE